MNKLQIITCILFTALFLLNCNAQERDSKKDLLDAKQTITVAANTASGELYLQAKSKLQPLKDIEEISALVYYYLGYIDYQMGVIVERMNKDRAADYIDSSIEYLDTAITKDETFAEAYALKASCYGIKISFAPLKGIILGPESGSLISKAKELTPENPRVALIDAISTYNTPSLFGGGKDKGLEKMKKAAEFFERWKESDSLQPSWGKEEVHAWIGVAYLERKETILARKSFEKALEINPNYGWVKYGLLPKVAK
jgi:tetratricopeptide (TPR) repeat protein